MELTWRESCMFVSGSEPVGVAAVPVEGMVEVVDLGVGAARVSAADHVDAAGRMNE